MYNTYVSVWYLCESLRRLRLMFVLNTYVCDGYLCLWSRFYVCVGYLCLWWYLWCIYVIYMWYLLFVWMENKKQRKATITAPGDGDGGFAECQRWHSATKISLPSVLLAALGKAAFFAECHLGHSAKSPPGRVPMSGSLPSVPIGTRQRRPLCRVLAT